MDKIKVLWLSTHSGLYNNNTGGNKAYNGGGWITSLQEILCEHDHIELAVAFVTNETLQKEKQGSTIYYPIYEKKKGKIDKIKSYYTLSVINDPELLLPSVLKVIQDYQPDVIHMFGIENRFAHILGHTSVPIVVHIQGLLAPCDNAFWPAGINKSSFLWPPSLKEWIFRNGFIFLKNKIHARAIKEANLLKKVNHFMGRTAWDYQVSRLFSPSSSYHVVDEVLRKPFYEHQGEWKRAEGKMIITSTVSETVYKGVDLIMKTAKLLKQTTQIELEWRVVGVREDSRMIRFFERQLDIDSRDYNISYCGVKSASEIVKTILDSSIYVHPSYIDNSPNSICEAQLLGIPVIACSVGGVSTLLEDGKTGTLVPANAPYELAYHVKNYLLCPQQYEEKRIVGLAAAKIRHDKQRIIHSLIDTYTYIDSLSKK